MDIYIVDSGSDLFAFARMDGVFRGLIVFKLKNQKNLHGLQ